MPSRFIVRPLAEADLEDAARWYEDERPGLAKRFLKDLEADPGAGDGWDVVQERLRKKFDSSH